MILSDLRRCFSMRMLLIVLLQPVIYMIPVIDVFFSHSIIGNEAPYCFEYARSVGFGKWLTPLFASIPGGLLIVEDSISNYNTFMHLRTGYKKYFTSKYFSAILSGSITIILGYLCFFVILISRFGFSIEFYESAVGNISSIAYYNYPMYLIGLLYLQGLGGALWASCTVVYSIYYPDYYYSLAVPLILSRTIYSISAWDFVPEWINLNLLIDGEIYGYRRTIITASIVFLLCQLLLVMLAFSGIKRRYIT